MTEPRLPPWKRREKSARPRKKLSPAQVVAARQRALDHKRRYPNLVDNMWAATLTPTDLAPKRDLDDFDPDGPVRI